MRAINLSYDLNNGSLRADSLDNLFHREGLELRLRCFRGDTPELLLPGSLLVATLKADLDGDAGAVLAEWVLPEDYRGYYSGLLVLSSDVLDALFEEDSDLNKTLYFQISHRPTAEDHPTFSQILDWIVKRPVVQPDDAPPLVLAPDPWEDLDARYGSLESRTAVVDVHGDDETGQVGNASRPFLTMQAAMEAIMVATPAVPSDFFTLRVNGLAAYESEVVVDEVDYRSIFLELKPGYDASTGKLNLTINYVTSEFGAHTMTLALRGDMGRITAKGIALTVIGCGVARVTDIIDISDPSDELFNVNASLTLNGTLRVSGNLSANGASGQPGKSITLNDEVQVRSANISPFGSGNGTLTVNGLATLGDQNSNLGVAPNYDSSLLRKSVQTYVRTAATSTLNATPQQMGGYVELPLPGIWLLSGQATVQLAGATFSTSRTITLKFHRLNNTEADVGTALAFPTQVTSAQTRSLGSCALPASVYETPRSGDRIAMYGDVSVAPSVGNLEVVQLSILAHRIG
ncbi:hypothetical protein [Verrucomicrobium spinosum]|uniref:hypothetical protein n=1 Tax=Verrucomicrobium spinosum TaxID=2736 RepID=UPI0012F68B41|nr:hypothetical protein [Verrucomicrobium spinosum]